MSTVVRSVARNVARNLARNVARNVERNVVRNAARNVARLGVVTVPRAANSGGERSRHTVHAVCLWKPSHFTFHWMCIPTYFLDVRLDTVARNVVRNVARNVVRNVARTVVRNVARKVARNVERKLVWNVASKMLSVERLQLLWRRVSLQTDAHIQRKRCFSLRISRFCAK